MMNQSEFLAITCKLLHYESAGKSLVQGAIGFGFTSYWLKNGHEISNVSCATMCSLKGGEFESKDGRR